MYDLIVIGAGSAGLTAVQFANQLGARVALVEKTRIGGDCTWTGCVPSKALLHVAKTFHTARQAQSFSAQTIPLQADMTQVKKYVQQTIHNVYQRESPEALQNQGVDIFMGAARFLNAEQIQAGEQVLTGKKFILATGARPFIPPIPGLEQVPYFTYHTLFENECLPERLLIVGAGPVGVEMAQAYGRLGASVTIIDEALFAKEDPEVAMTMASIFKGEGIEFVPGLVTAVDFDNKQIHLTVQHQSQTVKGDMLLVAAGRRPNVAGLALENAGVAYTEAGIQVNKQLQTTAVHIYAAGDCTGGLQFTHVAGWQGYKAVRNALLPGSSAGFSEIVPRVTFTDPEVAQVGLTEAAARSQFGEEAEVLTHQLSQEDRAQTDSATAGFVKLVHHEDGRLLGATIVAPRAGEMIAEISLALQNNLTLEHIAHTIHPYPTYASGLQMLASAQTMAAFQQSITGRLLNWLFGG